MDLDACNENSSVSQATIWATLPNEEVYNVWRSMAWALWVGKD